MTRRELTDGRSLLACPHLGGPVFRSLLLLLALTQAAHAEDRAVREAVAIADCAAVVAAVPPKGEQATDAERLAMGWCLRHTDPAAAILQLTKVDEEPFGRYARLLEAEAALGLGDAAKALASLHGVSLPEATQRRVTLLRAKALVALGRSLEARNDLRSLLDSELGDEARYVLAKGAEDRGDRDAAIVTYRRVWIDSTQGPWHGLAQEALARLGSRAPNLTTPTGREVAAARVEALTRAQQHGEALTLRADLHEAGLPWTEAEHGRLAFRARHYDEAVTAWRAAYQREHGLVGPASDLFDLALATSRTGDYGTAAQVYSVVISQFPGTRQAREASYKLGYLPYDEGRCDEAMAGFDAHLEAWPDSEYGTSALWLGGMCLYQAGRVDEALAVWDRLQATWPTSSLAPGVAYWKARTAGLKGDAQAQQAGMEAVLSAFPDSGHAWLAALALDRGFPEKPTVPRPSWPDRLDEDPAVVRAEALLKAGFRRWAAEELSAVESKAKRTRGGALALAHALIAAGELRRGRSLALPYCVDPWKDGDPIAQQACWPRPDAAMVSRTSKAYDLFALLPFAIMWSESALDPSVTSLAGARGLMQVMPAEGSRLHAEALGTGTFDADDLYLAPYNTLLGTTELGLKRRALAGVLADDDLPAVIASYNGGEAAVRRWLEAWSAPPTSDTFMEAVGYTETRRYVRSVLGHLMAYRWIYGDPE